MINTRIKINTRLSNHIIIALVTDLHDTEYETVINSLCLARPDLIAVCGDIIYSCVNGHSIYEHYPLSHQHLRYSKNAIGFFEKATHIAPVFFSSGNHELYLDSDDVHILNELGICYLDNSYTRYGQIVIGGLSSPYKILAGTGLANNKRESKSRWDLIFKNVKTDWLFDFASQNGYKVLLSHHPEFYDRFIKDKEGIDLVLSGHAHGGQIRLFGRGVYAYGQGWFPKYTRGVYDGKLIVSAGLANTSIMPRINNPLELVYIDLLPKG